MEGLKLNEILKTTYQSKKKGDEYFNKNNYFRDEQLSNISQRLYYNKENNKALITFRGTHNLFNDLPSDLDIALGTNIFGNRLNESRDFYKKAKDKYNDSQFIIAGHSLGSHLGSKVSKDKNDKIYSYNKGSGIGTILEKAKPNEKHYRTINDIVSFTSIGKKNTHNIKNYDINLFKTHSIKQLENIFI